MSHASNFLDNESKEIISLKLINIDSSHIRVIRELLLTSLQHFLGLGVDSNLGMVRLPVDTQELVDFSINLNLLMRDLTLVIFEVE